MCMYVNDMHRLAHICREIQGLSLTMLPLAPQNKLTLLKPHGRIYSENPRDPLKVTFDPRQYEATTNIMHSGEKTWRESIQSSLQIIIRGTQLLKSSSINIGHSLRPLNVEAIQGQVL